MILQALNEYYNRLSEQQDSDVSEPAYSPERISYEILLDEDCKVVQVNNISDTSGKKPKPRVLQVPQAEKAAASRYTRPNVSFSLGIANMSLSFSVSHTCLRGNRP